MYDPAQALRAHDALTTLLKAGGWKRPEPRLLTERLYEAFSGSFSSPVTDTLVFLGHNQLRLPDIACHAPIWVVSSTLTSAHWCQSTSEFNFLSSIPKTCPRTTGVITMNDAMFDHYKRLRTTHPLAQNGTLRLQDAQALRERLTEVVSACSPLDLYAYCEHLGTPIKENTAGKYIDDNLYLRGPYPFVLPTNLVIRGDLILSDLLYQPDLDNLTIEGQVRHLSNY